MSTLDDRRTGHREGEARKRAMTGVVERFKPGLTRRIQHAFLTRLMAQPTGTTDDIRGCVDPSPDAGTAVWGAALQGLVRDRLIRRVEYVPSSRPERHGCPVGLWTLAVEHAEAQRWLSLHPELPEPEPDDEAGQPGPVSLPSPRLAPAATHQSTLF